MTGWPIILRRTDGIVAHLDRFTLHQQILLLLLRQT